MARAAARQRRSDGDLGFISPGHGDRIRGTGHRASTGNSPQRLWSGPCRTRSVIQRRLRGTSVSTAEERSSGAGGAQGGKNVDLKLEVVVIPVSDADRSKDFYARLGWRLDADFSFDNGFRVVQFTPPGSGGSVQFGTKITWAAPGSAPGLYLGGADIKAARDQLAGLGADVSEVFHPGTPGAQFQPGDGSDRVSGPAPDRQSYGSFAPLRDPGGNTWPVPENTGRAP